MKIELSEEERQVTVFALIKLSVERPGWDWLMRSIAARLDPGLKLYDKFKHDVVVERCQGAAI